MKIIAMNGSPRKNWNTAALLNKVLEGAASQGAATELINLYDLQYKGCVSCFACKRKGGEHGKCAMKDDLTPILENLRKADAIVFGSPIYYSNITSGMVALLERFLFSNAIYSSEIPTVYPRKIPSAFIYAMNATEDQMDKLGYKEKFRSYENYITRTLGKPIELLYCCNTYQFTDYDKYESAIFSETAKAKQKAEQFPIDCQKAFDMGVQLVKNA
ncbi:MAG TPA: flavodoxin [Firmicutes bacterium]|jgi:multimeric flavodoxin WrbA|nr:flavodoxin [Bacillota bacterium]